MWIVWSGDTMQRRRMFQVFALDTSVSNYVYQNYIQKNLSIESRLVEENQLKMHVMVPVI